jgi:hypothetical protein
MSTAACKNCNHPFSGNFCSNCGQPVKTHRIDAHYFLHDIPHSILHVDKGFPFTFWQLIVSPARSLREYLEGKRVNFFRPLGYVVLMSAMCSVLISWIRKWAATTHSATTENIVEHQSFFSHYQSLFIFLMIPVVSLCTYLVFKKSHYNFWEHLLVNTFLAAQLNVLLVLIQLFLLLQLFTTGSLFFSLLIFMTFFMTYYAITFSGLMKQEIKNLELGLRLGVMCFVLATVYATAIAYSGLLR